MKKHEAELASKAAEAGEPRTEGPGEAEGPAPAAAERSQAQPADENRTAADIAARPGRRMPSFSRNSGYSELVRTHHDPGGSITEEYRSLRISLIAQCSDGKFCYVVTSSDPGEGKSVTCANLAVVLAEREDRITLLIDGDLRKPTLAKLLNVPHAPGMAEILRGRTTAAEVIQKTPYPNLYFVPAGQADMNEVGELLTRPDLEEFFRQVRRQYDYILVDSPPINNAPDAGMIGRATGNSLLVVRMGKTHRESVDRAVRLLHAAQVEVSGIVLTHRHYHIPHYLYRYS
jgi:capsular exopolysaccharide synthesis family protein